MQYVSNGAGQAQSNQSNLLFFSEADTVDDSDIFNDKFIIQARSCLGTVSRLNPIRGQKDQKYFHTFLRDGLSTSSFSYGTLVEALFPVSYYTPSKAPYASTASDSYETFAPRATTYAVRNVILNPKKVSEVSLPQATYSSPISSSVYNVFMYYPSNRNTRVAVATSVAAVGNPKVSASAFYYCNFIEGPSSEGVRSGTVGNFNITGRYGDGCVYTERQIEPENELPDLDYAIGYFKPFGTNGYVKYLPGIDYAPLDNQEPGTRPYVDFSAMRRITEL